jgi:uncharacterized surface protein with fasciclin (FAS1) repeats
MSHKEIPTTIYIMKKTTLLLTTALLFASPSLLADHHGETKTSSEETAAKEKKTIVETAAANEDFSILVKAIKAADLVEALNGEGPLTVFAPNNAAFEALPEGTLEELLKPENQEKLGEILKYHVTGLKIPAEKVATGKIETLAGPSLTVIANENKVMIDKAEVIKTDIMASNGIIHVIDKVLIPEAEVPQSE